MSFLFTPSFQQAALVLNASRRFRYTLDLERQEEKENLRRMLRSHAQVIRVISYLLIEETLFFSEVNTFFIPSLNSSGSICFQGGWPEEPKRYFFHHPTSKFNGRFHHSCKMLM
jgi:hypothetical protein